MLITALEAWMRRQESSFTGIVLYWFCGQHARDDPLSMVANLLGQLLDRGLTHLDPKELALPLDGLPRTFNNMKALFLNYLQLQLRRTPVYCVLDSVSIYEDHWRVRDLLDIWTALDELGRSENKEQHPLKLIATSPSRCLNIATRWDTTEPEVLWVPEQILGGEGTVDLARTVDGFEEVI